MIVNIHTFVHSELIKTKNWYLLSVHRFKTQLILAVAELLSSTTTVDFACESFFPVADTFLPKYLPLIIHRVQEKNAHPEYFCN